MKSLSFKLDLHHYSEKWQKIFDNGSQKYLLRSPNTIYIQKRFPTFFYPKPDNFTQSKSFENRKQFWFDVIIFKTPNILGRWVTGCGSACSAFVKSLELTYRPYFNSLCTYMIYWVCSRIRIDALENPRHLIMRACVFTRTSSRAKSRRIGIGWDSSQKYHFILVLK